MRLMFAAFAYRGMNEKKKKKKMTVCRVERTTDSAKKCDEYDR